jgi:uncharacterized membrane protein YtjA (UPF0391 family)
LPEISIRTLPIVNLRQLIHASFVAPWLEFPGAMRVQFDASIANGLLQGVLARRFDRARRRRMRKRPSAEARRLRRIELERLPMLNLALVLFVAAIVAALSGRGSIATGSGVPQVLFFFFLAVFLTSLIEGLRGRFAGDLADGDGEGRGSRETRSEADVDKSDCHLTHGGFR